MLSISKALLGSRGRVDGHALGALHGIRRVNMHVVLTSNHPACNLLPLTGGLRLNVCGNCVLSCGNNRIVGTSGNRVVFRQHVGLRRVPCLRGGTRGGKFTVLACSNSAVVAGSPRGPRIRTRTSVGKVGLLCDSLLSLSIRRPPYGYVLIDSSRATLVSLRNR